MSLFQRLGVLISGLIAVAVGVLFGLVTFVFVDNVGGHPLEDSSYCSKYGIGRDDDWRSEGKPIIYDESELGGFPPTRSCQVILVDDSDSNPRLSAQEILERDPGAGRVLAEGSWPNAIGWAVVVAAFLIPVTIWLLVTGFIVRPRPRPRPRSPL